VSRASLGDEMYRRIYFEVQDVLNVALGTEEDDGAGAGLVAEVMLLAQRYEELRLLVDPAVVRDVESPEMVEELLSRFGKRAAAASAAGSSGAAS